MHDDNLQGGLHQGREFNDIRKQAIFGCQDRHGRRTDGDV